MIPIESSEKDVFEFLKSIKGQKISGCITDLPYATKERYRRIGTTTRTKVSDSSSNPWFATMDTDRLAKVLAAIYDALAPNSFCFAYVDDDTALLLAHKLGVATSLLDLQDKATSKAPRDAIGFSWWTPLTWGKATRQNSKEFGKVVMTPRPGTGYHGQATTERILFLEKGKRQLTHGFTNLLLAPRPAAKPVGATLRAASPKPIEIAELLARSMAEQGSTIIDPFVGCGTHAVGIYQAGQRALVNDVSLAIYRDHMRAYGFMQEGEE